MSDDIQEDLGHDLWAPPQERPPDVVVTIKEEPCDKCGVRGAHFCTGGQAPGPAYIGRIKP